MTFIGSSTHGWNWIYCAAQYSCTSETCACFSFLDSRPRTKLNCFTLGSNAFARHAHFSKSDALVIYEGIFATTLSLSLLCLFLKTCYNLFSSTFVPDHLLSLLHILSLSLSFFFLRVMWCCIHTISREMTRFAYGVLCISDTGRKIVDKTRVEKDISFSISFKRSWRHDDAEDWLKSELSL